MNEAVPTFARGALLTRLSRAFSIQKNLSIAIAGSLALITNLAILFDLPVLRQIFGFMFLTLVPGIFLVQFVRSSEFRLLEKTVLCWGLSVAFVMFYSLLLNSVLPQFGYAAPLSSIPLLLSFDLVFASLGFLSYWIGSNDPIHFPTLELTTANGYLYITPLFFPLLSIIGSFVMGTGDINTISLSVLFLAAIYVVYVFSLKERCPRSLYPILIYSVSLSVLLLGSLRSNHIVGWDLHSEYYFFESILRDHHLIIGDPSQAGYALYAGVASIILPVVYQLILGADQEALFNIIYALLFSIVPLVVYIISKKYVEERYALIASLFYISLAGFMHANPNSRATIAILFFAFAFMMLFVSGKQRTIGEFGLFILFASAGLVSHYSTAYIFLIVIVTAIVIVGFVSLRSKGPVLTKISASLGVLFFAVTFLWYAILAESTSIYNGVQFLRESLMGIIFDFWNPQTRADAPAALGAGVLQKTYVQQMEFVLTWAVVLSIMIGVMMLVIKRKEMVDLRTDQAKPAFLRARFEVEYCALALACSGMIVLSVALPYFAQVYSLERMFYFVATILSTLFVIGIITLSSFVRSLSQSVRTSLLQRTPSSGGIRALARLEIRAHPTLVVALSMAIIFPYLLCTSGAAYAMAGAPGRGLPFDSSGFSYSSLYIHDQESFAAKWLGARSHPNASISTIDSYGLGKLVSQGHIPPHRIDYWWFQKRGWYQEYTYLTYFNCVDRKYFVNNASAGIYGDMGNASAGLLHQKKILDNGGSQIYYRGT